MAPNAHCELFYTPFCAYLQAQLKKLWLDKDTPPNEQLPYY